MAMQIEDDVSSVEVMRTFYNRLYPFKSIFTWLNHGHKPERLFMQREFALTTLDDAYLRYNSYLTHEDMRKHIARITPSRFEIGAIYNMRPSDKRTARPGTFQPVKRELVFDIDMTDYDEVRTCCSGKGICKRCWGFIAVAVKILDACLRVQFGFRHILWVYSGRRGIHCWVSDDEAMSLTDEQRKVIMGWLEVIKGGKDMAKKVNVRGPQNRAALHPSLRTAALISRNEFLNLIINDQDCFSTPEQTNVLLEIIRTVDQDVAARLDSHWKEHLRNSEEKWTDLRREALDQKEKLKRAAKNSERSTNVENDEVPLLRLMEDITLQYTYPRLDAEVSKHRNHLLKAPFCVHPATGRICVPVDPREVDSFDPEAVPTVGQLLRELGTFGENEGASEGNPQSPSDWERTSLKPYVDMLDAHARSLMDEVRRVKREQAASNDLTF